MLKRDFRSEKKRGGRRWNWRKSRGEKRTTPAADDADAWGNDTVKAIPTSIQLQL